MAHPATEQFRIQMQMQAQVFRQAALADDDPIDEGEFVRFIESSQIATKDKGRQSLSLWRPQEIILEKILEARRNRIPGRFICLKGRQMGVSTLLGAIIFGLLWFQAFRYALLAVQDDKNGIQLFDRVKRLYRFRSGAEKLSRPLAMNTKHILQFDSPHESMFQVSTANDETLGSSQTVHYAHCSEVAKYDDPPATDALVSLQQCVPPHWNSLIFWESTAYGAHDLFHRSWLRAMDKMSDFEPIFLPWKGFPLYSIPITPGYSPQFDQRELEYKREHELSDEEMLWAQRKRRNDCHDDWDQFLQEFPLTPEEAFRFSGNPWFGDTAEKIEIAPPIRIGRFVFLSDEDPVIDFIDSPDGYVELWEEFDSNYRYVIGTDTGEGVKADYSVAWVLKLPNTTQESLFQVAKIRTNRIPGGELGIQLYMMGRYYGRALTGVERNRGLDTLQVLEHGHPKHQQMKAGYPNLYYHTYTDRKNPEETKRLGWITTKTSKEFMLQHFQQIMYEDSIVIRSSNSKYEMQGFIWDPEHEKWVQRNPDPITKLCHDDEIMAGAIALQMAQFSVKGRSMGTIQDEGW